MRQGIYFVQNHLKINILCPSVILALLSVPPIKNWALLLSGLGFKGSSAWPIFRTHDFGLSDSRLNV